MATDAVGLSRDLPLGRVMRADVRGKDVVLWRSMSGALSVWANRCPHRGMRLSHGFVRGESLACLYHGWHYGQDATCRFIPAHPDLEPPATIRPEQFRAVERNGIIWVAIEGTPMPGETPTGLAPFRSMRFACRVENLPPVFRTTSLHDFAPIGSDMTDGTIKVEFSRQIMLVAVLRSVPGDRTDAHLLVSEGLNATSLTRLSRWCEAARRHAEADGNTREGQAA